MWCLTFFFLLWAKRRKRKKKNSQKKKKKYLILHNMWKSLRADSFLLTLFHHNYSHNHTQSQCPLCGSKWQVLLLRSDWFYNACDSNSTVRYGKGQYGVFNSDHVLFNAKIVLCHQIGTHPPHLVSFKLLPTGKNNHHLLLQRSIVGS